MSILKGGTQTVNYLSFDGVDDYIEINNNLNGLANKIEIHINSNILIQDGVVSGFLLGSDSIDANQIATGSFTGGFSGESLTIRGPSGAYTMFSNILQPDTFYILEFIWNGSQYDLYVNNNLIQGQTITTHASRLDLSLINNIARWGNRENRYFDGNIYFLQIQDSNNNTVLQYNFDEGSGTTINDSVGNNDGTIIGATWQTDTVNPAIDNIYYGGAIVENHLSFDGVDDYVDLPTINISNTTEYTISGSFRTDMTNIGHIITSDLYKNSSAKRNFQVRVQPDGKMLLLRYTQNGFDEFTSNSVVNNNQIVHFSFVVDINDFGSQLYINGVLDRISPDANRFDNQFDTSFNDINIGAHKTNINLYEEFFDGDIFNIQIWDRALTSTEINNYITTLPTGNEQGLIAYYDFSDGSGTTLTDSAGTNDGTINGATWQSDTTYPTIDRVYAGGALVYGQAPVYTYELIADVEVTSNTTQIDFDNLNITKDDELRLVWTLLETSTTLSRYSMFVNDISNNYYSQRLQGVGSSLNAARFLNSIFSFGRNDVTSNGYADIKISNNDRFVSQVHDTVIIGSFSSNIENSNYNIINTSTITNINKLTIESNEINGIDAGSRLQLYKVNKGVA